MCVCGDVTVIIVCGIDCVVTVATDVLADSSADVVTVAVLADTDVA